MKSLEVFSSLLASAAARTHIKKSIIDNRIKFDKEVLFHGDAEFWEDYDDWDPYTDLDDDEIEDIMRRIAAHMDANKDGYVDIGIFSNKFINIFKRVFPDLFLHSHILVLNTIIRGAHDLDSFFHAQYKCEMGP